MSTTRTLVSLVAVSFLCFGALKATDERKQPASFLNDADLPAKYREAAATVAAVLRSETEDAREFKAEVEERERGRIFVFHLWHKSAFEPPNKGGIGNPGGRCRDVSYDTKAKKASRSLFWQ